MLCYTLFFTLFITVFGVRSLERCRDTTPIAPEIFNETMCASAKWFLYAASEKCDNCCATRTMVLLEPGTIAVTDVTTQDGVTNTYFYTVRKERKRSVYHVIGSTNPLIMLDTDCTTYAILYTKSLNLLQVMTTSPEQEPGFLDSLERVTACDMTLYDHNPAETCAE